MTESSPALGFTGVGSPGTSSAQPAGKPITAGGNCQGAAEVSWKQSLAVFEAPSNEMDIDCGPAYGVYFAIDDCDSMDGPRSSVHHR
jgi:hypothetical protein